MGFPLLASGARRERRRRPVRIPITERERSKYLRGASYLLTARPAFSLGLVSSSSGSGLSGFGLYIMPLAALFSIYPILRFWRGLSFGVLEALRWAVGGETMTIPGGTGTPRKVQLQLPPCSAHRPLS